MLLPSYTRKNEAVCSFKHWYPLTRLHRVITQKTTIHMLLDSFCGHECGPGRREIGSNYFTNSCVVIFFYYLVWGTVFCMSWCDIHFQWMALSSSSVYTDPQIPHPSMWQKNAVIAWLQQRMMCTSNLHIKVYYRYIKGCFNPLPYLNIDLFFIYLSDGINDIWGYHHGQYSDHGCLIWCCIIW
jgi:hypothetical protein